MEGGNNDSRNFIPLAGIVLSFLPPTALLPTIVMSDRRKGVSRVQALEAEREHELHLARLAKVKAHSGVVAKPSSMGLAHMQRNYKRLQMEHGTVSSTGHRMIRIYN